MDLTTKLRIVRQIERTSRQHGFAGDATLEPDTVRPLGTLREQLAMVCVGLDSGVRLNQMSSREQRWTRERLRSAVLGGKSSDQIDRSTTIAANDSAALQRVWRRGR